MTDMEIRSNGITYTDWLSGATIGSMSAVGLSVAGSSTQSSDSSLTIAAQNGKNAFLQLAGGFLIQKAGGIWNLQTGSAAQSLLLDTGINVPVNNVSAVRQQANYTLDNTYTLVSNITGTCQSPSCDNGAQQGFASWTAAPGTSGNKYTWWTGVNSTVSDTGSNADWLNFAIWNLSGTTNTNLQSGRTAFLDLKTGTSITIDVGLVKFEEAAGTSKALDAGTTKAAPGIVDGGWMKVILSNGSTAYIPVYASKT